MTPCGTDKAVDPLVAAAPPWFNVRLPNATTDGIEVRLGTDVITSQATEDILFELLVIYIR